MRYTATYSHLCATLGDPAGSRDFSAPPWEIRQFTLLLCSTLGDPRMRGG
ncbi:MAG: hypothetical protein WBG62_18440 [Cyclobacteriaceae bacterium]